MQNALWLAPSVRNQRTALGKAAVMKGDKKIQLKSRPAFKGQQIELWPSLLGVGEEVGRPVHTQRHGWVLGPGVGGGAGYRISAGYYGCKAFFNRIPVHCVGVTVFPRMKSSVQEWRVCESLAQIKIGPGSFLMTGDSRLILGWRCSCHCPKPFFHRPYEKWKIEILLIDKY